MSKLILYLKKLNKTGIFINPIPGSVILLLTIILSFGCSSQKKTAGTSVKTEPVAEVDSIETVTEIPIEEEDIPFPYDFEQYKTELNQHFRNIIVENVTEEEFEKNMDTVLDNFDSPQTPVLTVVGRKDDHLIYDKPTTIKLFLEYIKDHKKTNIKIKDMELDEDGKISKLTLLR